MAEGRSNQGCLKYGCIGCVVVIALAVGLVFVLGAVQMSVERPDPEPVARDVEHPLPPAPPGADPDRPPTPELLPLPEGARAEPPPAGRILLDVRAARFTVVPVASDQPIRLRADYDSALHSLTEELVEEDGGWTYKLDFGPRGGFAGLLFRGGDDAGDNRLELEVPRGRPLEIVGAIGVGESELDLSGLLVRRVDLDLGAGEHFMEFGEPVAIPAELFALDSSVGSVEVRSLGNLSPATVEVDHSIGELYLDLAGAWQRDATVDVDFSIGECRVFLPREARTVVARSSVTIGEKTIDSARGDDLPPDAPTLTLSLSGSIGEVRVER